MPPPAFEFRGQNKENNWNNDRRPRPNHEFTFRFPRSTAERPLLTSKRESTPELLVGSGDGADKAPLKFAHLDEITDSDEAEMDVSDSDSDNRPPRKKRVVDPAPVPVPQAVKWSNPDPYTALPPPDETQAKRPDVVKLIRKARLAASAPVVQADAVTTNEDFISFDVGDFGDVDTARPPENAPKGPRSDRLGEVAAGKKRTHDDEVKGYTRKFGRPLGTTQDNGNILHHWRAKSTDNGTPWYELMESTLHLGTRFHNEILAFYNWVKPRPYEDIIRKDLVYRLQEAFNTRYRGAEVQSFGSFASGIYLPIADMDLVLISPNFLRNGRKDYGEKKAQIYQFAAFIKHCGVAVPNSVETIAKARVPILKFVDKLTGLKVDLSFDNDSGLLANRTFQRWKAEYPTMPVIVSIIKQFLLLRGLNEVPTGGLGGFSIICLVVSLLQHMPRGQQEEPCLGSILMDFFDFYGNKFDYSSVGIMMDPPGYFNKQPYDGRDASRPRLAIEDPNNKNNDISGGTKDIGLILECFSRAYDALKDRVVSLATSKPTSPRKNDCFLDTILSACYDEYDEQRAHLRTVYESDPRFAEYYGHLTPPPPPSESEYDPEDAPAPPPPPLPAPPSPVHTTPKVNQPAKKKAKLPPKKNRKAAASLDRAARLKQLMPELAHTIPDSISAKEAFSLSGYHSQSEFDSDLSHIKLA